MWGACGKLLAGYMSHAHLRLVGVQVKPPSKRLHFLISQNYNRNTIPRHFIRIYNWKLLLNCCLIAPSRGSKHITRMQASEFVLKTKLCKNIILDKSKSCSALILPEFWRILNHLIYGRVRRILGAFSLLCATSRSMVVFCVASGGGRTTIVPLPLFGAWSMGGMFHITHCHHYLYICFYAFT